MKQWCEAHLQRCAWSKATVGSTLPSVLFVFAVIFSIAAVPLGAFGQTRAECNKCCTEMFADDYYAEQCKLKCFRDTNHCKSLRASKQSASGQPAQSPSVDRQVIRPETPARTRPETAPPRESQPRRGERAAPRQAPFVWPETLVLNPGREWEAAGQILAANGIPPQHPNYTPALKAIEQVLIDFARTNPGGGELPTDQLERIIRQTRR